MPRSQIQYIDTAANTPLLLIPAPSVLASSVSAPWSGNGIAVEHLRLPAMEMPESAVKTHLLTLKLGSLSMLEWKAGKRFQCRRLVPGDVCFAPAGAPRQLRWQETVEILGIALDPDRVARFAPEAGRSGRVELIETHGASDPQVFPIGMALLAEMESGYAGGRLYADSLFAALSARLLTKYNAFSFSPAEVRSSDSLPTARLRQVTDYIEENLERDLSLTDLADAARMSVSRFKTLFREAMGITPHQYVIQQRVERAKQLLLKGNGSSPGQIAAQVGFYDQSHLNRHFKRLVGVTPGAFAEHR